MIRRAGEDDDGDATTDDAVLARVARVRAPPAPRGCSEQSIVHPFGEAFLNPSLARAYVLNTLHVDAEVDADQLVAALDDLYGELPPPPRVRRALRHRRAHRGRAAPAPLARRARPVTWSCAGRATARREPGLAREVDAATLQVGRGARASARSPTARTRRSCASSSRCARRSRGRCRRRASSSGASDGVDAAVTTLYSDGVVAQVEDVATLRDFRRRGLARGDGDARRSTRRSRWATSSIFIVADDDDWPKDLYARLGFDPVGRAWAFTRPGPEHPAHVATP